MSKALVLAASLQQAEELHKQIAAAKFSDLQFIYPSKVTHEVASPSALLEDCYEVIKAEEVDVLISMHPGVDMVHAALLLSFPHIRGPSCESLLLCVHKYYNRQLTLGTFSLPYVMLELEDLEDAGAAEMKVAAAMDMVPRQAYIRDAYDTPQCAATRCVRMEQTFWKELDKMKKEVAANQNSFQSFLNSYIHHDKYPKAFQSTMLIEEYWQMVAKDVNVHLVEACVSEGQFIPWILSDVTLSRTKPRCLTKVSIPTKIDGFMEMEVWGVIREVVQRLIDVRFDNHFVNAIVLTSGESIVKVADINSCILRENTPMYKHVYQNGDNVRAQLELCCGKMLRNPRVLPLKFACRGSIEAFGEDFTLADIMDIKEAKANSHVDLLVPTSESWTTKKSDFGTRVARFYVYGASEEDCTKQTEELLKTVLKAPQHTNWAKRKD